MSVDAILLRVANTIPFGCDVSRIIASYAERRISDKLLNLLRESAGGDIFITVKRSNIHCIFEHVVFSISLIGYPRPVILIRLGWAGERYSYSTSVPVLADDIESINSPIDFELDKYCACMAPNPYKQIVDWINRRWDQLYGDI